MKIFVIFLTMFLTLTTGCIDKSPTTKEPLPTKESMGVILHGCIGSQNTPDKGYFIENTNAHPVRIHRVWSTYGYGETTESIDVIEPGAKLLIKYVPHGFYIYTIDGILIGWIGGSCKN